MMELYHNLRDQGFQLVGLTKINKSATPEKVRQFIAEEGIDYPIAKEDGSLSRHFKVSGIPAAAILKDNVIIWRGHPSWVSEQLIKSWLK